MIVSFSVGKRASVNDAPLMIRLGGINVQAAAIQPRGAPATVTSAVVPQGLDAVNLRVHAARGAPDITVTAPDGATASTAGLPPNRIIKGASFTLARFPTLNETIIAPRHAIPGRYRIVTN